MGSLEPPHALRLAGILHNLVRTYEVIGFSMAQSDTNQDWREIEDAPESRRCICFAFLVTCRSARRVRSDSTEPSHWTAHEYNPAVQANVAHGAPAGAYPDVGHDFGSCWLLASLSSWACREQRSRRIRLHCPRGWIVMGVGVWRPRRLNAPRTMPQKDA